MHKEGTIEILENTDVFLDIPPGVCGVIIGAVHTDPTPFLDVIPDDQCLIAPIVTLCYRPISDEYSLDKLKANPQHYFTIHLPHIATENKSSIVVRCELTIESPENRSLSGHIMRLPHKGDAKTISSKGTFTTDDNEHGDEILIETQQFCNYIATSTECRCEREAVGLIYGGFGDQAKAYAKMMVYLASSLYKKKAFRNVSTCMYDARLKNATRHTFFKTLPL